MDSYTQEVKRPLREHGCAFHRQGKDDHEIWWSPITSRMATVDGKIKSSHTANRILKDAGTDKRL